MKELRLRCWIEENGERLFGPGPLDLLLLIEKEGSLSKAAKEMGMSYKKAWDIINKLNNAAKSPIVISKKGGAKGGSAEITEHGKEIIKEYEKLVGQLDKLAQKKSKILDLM